MTTQTIYTYTTKLGLNVETFDSRGYVTLERDGKHVYEHQFSHLGLQVQEAHLNNNFDKYDVKFTKVIKES